MESRGVTVEQLAQQKYRLKTALEEKIKEHRRNQRTKGFQQVLFENRLGDVEVSPEECFQIREDQYAPNWYYEGPRLPKHLFPTIGELKSDGEEWECASFIATHPKVKHWVRNLERKPEASFWLQTATDRFYPDFLALLEDGRILVVESKGEHLWSNDDSQEKLTVGELWAARSGGKCLFVMPKGKDWNAIQSAIG
jgi:type III restriction enzyme